MLTVNNLNFISPYSSLGLSDLSFFSEQVIASENKLLGELQINFVQDEELLQINLEALNHDYYTDIITFDYTVGNILHGDLFISIDRVKENANILALSFEQELFRVIAHGILHLCGYDDQSKDDIELMRLKEEEKIKLFHVKQ
ncbi:MAG: rRNA maturation RNase YbeY [Flavobacteriaceae bacterium]|nr:rRNA maturation RNase YbeY [Flavobacteriaceae bacterium]